MKEEVMNELLDKEEQLVKEVDKSLIAERIAIEVKSHLEVYGEGHSAFNGYLKTARDTLEYTEKEELEILNLSKKILLDKYNIKVLSDNPFKYEKN